MSCAWSLVNVDAAGDLKAAALVAAAKAHHETDNVVAASPVCFGRRLPPAGSESGRVSSGRRWRAAAVVASLAVGITLWVFFLSWQSPMTFQTVVGEQSSFTLQDGSVVFLNTNSKVRIGWLPAERHIELVRGEARFKVARDASRPFTVATSTAAVRDLGTVFNVRAEPLSTQVAVLEGQVEVTVAPTREPPGIRYARALQIEGSTAVQPPAMWSRVRLAAGERAAVTSQGIQTNTGPTIEAVMAWTQRRLVFRDQPLEAVVRRVQSLSDACARAR